MHLRFMGGGCGRGLMISVDLSTIRIESTNLGRRLARLGHLTGDRITVRQYEVDLCREVVQFINKRLS